MGTILLILPLYHNKGTRSAEFSHQAAPHHAKVRLSVPTVIKFKPGCLKFHFRCTFLKCRYKVCNVFFQNNKKKSFAAFLSGDPMRERVVDFWLACAK